MNKVENNQVEPRLGLKFVKDLAWKKKIKKIKTYLICRHITQFGSFTTLYLCEIISFQLYALKMQYILLLLNFT